MKNMSIDLAAPRTVFHPNADTWGLRDHALTVEPGASPSGVPASTARDGGWSETPVFALMMLRLAVEMMADRVVIFCAIRHRIWSGRLRRLRRELAGQSAVRWPSEIWRLWSSRQRRT